jgi:hypothetical protein
MRFVIFSKYRIAMPANELFVKKPLYKTNIHNVYKANDV